MDMITPPQLEAQLQRDERLIWSGRPLGRMQWRRGDLVPTLFGLVFLAFATFWESGVVGMGRAPVFFIVWGAAFIAIGLFMVLGRLPFRAWQERRTVYGVTNLSVIVVVGRRTIKIPLTQVGPMEVELGGDGRGQLLFRNHVAPSTMPRLNHSWNEPPRLGFEDIPRPADVRNLIIDAAQPS